MSIKQIITGEHYVLFTDGSCSVGLKAGGWGAVLYRMRGKEIVKGPHQISGCCTGTTNNEMELTAALRGLRCLQDNIPIIVYTDSKYLIGGMTEWLPGWIKRDWWKSDGTPVVNADLWRALLVATEGRSVHWEWVPGHAGHDGNERADRLAQAAMLKAKKLLTGGSANRRTKPVPASSGAPSSSS